MKMYLLIIVIIFFVSLIGWMRFYKNARKGQAKKSKMKLTTVSIILLVIFAGVVFFGGSLTKKSNMFDKYESVEAFKTDCIEYKVDDIYTLSKDIKKNTKVKIDGKITEINDKYMKIVDENSNIEDKEFYLLVSYNTEVLNETLKVGDNVRLWGICTGIYIKDYHHAQITAGSIEVLKK